MRIIPAIDIIDGKCVRLTQGDYDQKKIYNQNPLEVAKGFEDAGLKYLHLVDLDGAKAGKVTNWQVVENICRHTSLTVDFGGGIKTDEDISKLLEHGIHQVNVGSIAVNEPEKVYSWITRYGADKIILSADVKNEKIAINGWQKDSQLDIIDFIQQYQLQGIQYITCTDIGTDGMLNGPNVILYKKLLSNFPELKIIASGGVSSLDDLKQLEQSGVEGTIVGKAIYEGRVTLESLLL